MFHLRLLKSVTITIQFYDYNAASKIAFFTEIYDGFYWGYIESATGLGQSTLWHPNKQKTQVGFETQICIEGTCDFTRHT